MRYCVQATKVVQECQTHRIKGRKMSFCAPAKITQEVCVLADKNTGNIRPTGWIRNALEQWNSITRVEKPFIMVPSYHCESYQYVITPAGLDEPVIDDKCSMLKSIMNYFFAVK